MLQVIIAFKRAFYVLTFDFLHFNLKFKKMVKFEVEVEDLSQMV